ncbi:hypothetical protein OsI_19894 [Oryza sativa Indica Group]|uniref:Uncharacterized protein n=3 Tax=Oryza TaxID=4527 RepID=A0A0E0PM84_ORYRU|nr:hypothetical protein OsI_19894 [Oryza sativa Indica Group]
METTGPAQPDRAAAHGGDGTLAAHLDAIQCSRCEQPTHKTPTKQIQNREASKRMQEPPNPGHDSEKKKKPARTCRTFAAAAGGEGRRRKGGGESESESESVRGPSRTR